MSDNNSKAWKKTEDIPKRFDELPPEPEWVPVADVIRTQREDEAKKEAQKMKIMPPMDSSSDSENEIPYEKVVKEEKPPKPVKNENVREHETSKQFSDISVPPTVDDVTRSMVEWALNTDYYPKKAPKQPSHYKEPKKPPVGQQRPSHFVLDKGHNVRERHISKQSNSPFMGDLKKHNTPHDNYFSQPGMDSPQKMQRYSTGAARTRTQQSTSSHNERHPLYDEPSPDYDEDYNAYYSRYQEQYYYDKELKNDEYYYQEQGYEDEVVPYPKVSGAGLYHDESPSHDQHIYNDSPGDFMYEYDMPQYPHADQRGYSEALPHYSQIPHEIPQGKPNSSYDVLY